MFKLLYITRIGELDKAQRFRFVGTFAVAIYMMILMPIIKKYQGVFFATQLITILMVMQQLSNKFLESFNKKFKIGQIFHMLIWAQVAEILVLFSYFYDFKLMIYLFSFSDILLAFVAMSYGIKLTSLYAKQNPQGFKKLPIFKQNIWAEGFMIGLIISFGLQYLGIAYVIACGILVRSSILFYMIYHYNFYDEYFKERS